MYILAQIWWFLILAFLLGVLIGYLIWRSCGRRELQASYERQRKDLMQGLQSVKQERDRFSAAAGEAEQENARLKEALLASSKGSKAAPSHEART